VVIAKTIDKIKVSFHPQFTALIKAAVSASSEDNMGKVSQLSELLWGMFDSSNAESHHC
jgi:hypothetical protein